jgi:hypothetical protein
LVARLTSSASAAVGPQATRQGTIVIPAQLD